ncbi:MAG: protein kinase [Deltaproteobacteria bacterium]|nr:protein kinase [Deltaproteobacteria bacterium]
MSQVPTSIGKYTIIRRLAIGGMAELLLAASDGTPGPVVLKRPLPQYLLDDEYLRMFVDEARIASLLRHDNIARILDVGEHEGSPFFTMEYVHGKDLRTLQIAARRRGAGLPLPYAMELVLGVARALHHAHEQVDETGSPLGIVHRDVTPANVLVDFEGGVKLIDFGVVKARTRQTETRAGIIKGKIAYMSPEQARGMAVDRRSDIYALGVLLYELTTGTRLYKTGSDFELLTQITTGTVPPPSSRLPGYPAALETILMRALSRQPEERHASADELALDLEGLAGAMGVTLGSAALRGWLRSLFADELAPAPAVMPHATPPSTPALARPLTPVPAPARPLTPAPARPITPVPAPARAPRPVTPVPAPLSARPPAPAPVPATSRLATPAPAPARQVGDPLLSGQVASVEVDDSFEIDLSTEAIDELPTSDFQRLSFEELYAPLPPLVIKHPPTQLMPARVPGVGAWVTPASPSPGDTTQAPVAPVAAAAAVPVPVPVPMPVPVPVPVPVPPSPDPAAPQVVASPNSAAVRRADATARVPASRSHLRPALPAQPRPRARERARTRLTTPAAERPRRARFIKVALALAALIAGLALWLASTRGDVTSDSAAAASTQSPTASTQSPTATATATTPTRGAHDALMPVGFIIPEASTRADGTDTPVAAADPSTSDGTPLPAQPAPTRKPARRALATSSPSFD